MSDDKPTGVFVRLPLSDRQELLLWDKVGDDDFEGAILAIGTPVTGGELYPVGYINEDAIGGLATGIYQSASIFRDEDAEHHDTVALTRQSDALAKLAEKDAEIARLRDALNDLVKSSRKVNARGASVGTQWVGFGVSIGTAEYVLKGGAA